MVKRKNEIIEIPVEPSKSVDRRSSSKGPSKLLERLALKERPKLDKKEIKEITQRWYKELPEVKLKEKEEQKKTEHQMRL